MSEIHPIDRIMEQASQELVDTHYAACERSCVQALAMAHEAGDWDRFARIILPLQEARRQRRQIAEDAGVIVVTERVEPDELLNQHDTGVLLLLDPPFSKSDESAIRALARQRALFIEVLRLDPPALKAACLRALEDRGDTALAQLRTDTDVRARLDALYDRLDEIGDHEIAHQRLAQLARERGRMT